MRRRLLALAGALVAVAAPAAAQEAPAADTLRVSAIETLQREVVGLLRDRVPGPRGELIVWWVEGQPAPPVIQLLDSNVPDSLFPAVRGAADRFLAAHGRSVRLSVRLDRMVVRDRVDAVREEEGPRLENGERVREVLLRLRRLTRRDASAVVSVLVDPTGEVAAVDILRPTGDPETDSYLHAVGYEMRFRPARIDGRPVPVWVSTTLSLTL